MVLPAFLCVFTPWVIITANVHELSDMFDVFQSIVSPQQIFRRKWYLVQCNY